MLGFVKKDLFILKNNVKSLLIAIAIYAIFIFSNDMDVSFIFPFMVFMLFISTFSYDDYNKWNAFALTLPKGRENIVKGKYVSVILLVFVATLLGSLCSALIFSLKNTLNLEQILSNSITYFITIFIIASIICPLLFKYGSEKGRIVLFVMIFGIFSMASIARECTDIVISGGMVSFFHQYGLILLLFLSILMMIISYVISKRIYLKKEF